MSVYRIFVEKKEGFNIAAKTLLKDINQALKLNIKDLRIFLMYDIEEINPNDLTEIVDNVFSEPPADRVFYEELPPLQGYKIFGVEYLKGQYDQRADSASQCVELLLNKNRPLVATATVYAFEGATDKDLTRIEGYIVNPTDSKITDLLKPITLRASYSDNDDIEYLDGFITMNDQEIKEYHKNGSFAMSVEDLAFVKDYFAKQKRNPTLTEIKVIDTYWSDHCRHTTFLTKLLDIDTGDNKAVADAYSLYLSIFKDLYKNRPEKYISLMDIATIGTKAIKKAGFLKDIDESDEINACSINVKVKVDGKEEDWLVMFKNETHNHPTEIEPFGGAATCLGGAIRDPLSGRVYVYQAMRVTGAGDIFKDIDQTMEGKLAQRVISKTAAKGFSSYGNQIGLATGIVSEIHHDNYQAKRLETGFVIGAAPKENVKRAAPVSGDKIILLGGETGRDGCGGATGSSKAHNKESVNECGAEVQKGNPLTERKIQRFFRNKEASSLIKKCNDFGAGGISVAIGELSDGLDIWLDLVPKKYKGLSVTETAISESQERMAVVVAERDVEKFLSLVKEENLDATIVAAVTDTNRLRMFNKGQSVVDIDRDFLNTNGVEQTASVKLRSFKEEGLFEVYDEKVKTALKNQEYTQALKEMLKDKNVMIQKGLSEYFDSTIGAGSVFMPFGGAEQLTPATVMAAKIPTLNGFTDTTSVCSYAFNPYITDNNPYFGSLYATLASVAKLVSAGVDYKGVRLTLQEFFKRLNKNPERFGEPFSALLGALKTQYELKTPAIGGKDSMSGSFEDIDVPNTLISFAVGIEQSYNLITNVFKKGDKVYRLPLSKKLDPDFEYIRGLFDKIHSEIRSKNIKASAVVETGGAVSSVVKSTLGNLLTADFTNLREEHFKARLGDILVVVENENILKGLDYEFFATIDDKGYYTSQNGLNLSFSEAKAALLGFESVYPYRVNPKEKIEFKEAMTIKPTIKAKMAIASPKVLIPVFPGTNCEYDTAKRFEMEGAKTQTFVIKNSNSTDITNSIKELTRLIKSSQIIAFPGGFSGGDEPDGSGKFIAATFRNPFITEAIDQLLSKRDGLILGICNGFQALIKLGLLPYGKIAKLKEDSPTLTFNTINRHVSTICKIRVANNNSPWLNSFKIGQTFLVPVSHGEGRIVANQAQMEQIIKNGHVATQYADYVGQPTMEAPFNPNGSFGGIEGLISADGRVFGKMGHTERYQKNLYLNVEGDFDMNIFKNGVDYYK